MVNKRYKNASNFLWEPMQVVCLFVLILCSFHALRFPGSLAHWLPARDGQWEAQSGLGVDQAFAARCSLQQPCLLRGASSRQPPPPGLPGLFTPSLSSFPSGRRESGRFSPLLVSGLPRHAPQAFQLFLHLCHQLFVLNSVC